jgi:PTS hybrid protein
MAARVGMVLVSHSERLAAGLAELLAQLAPDVRVEVAGGTAAGDLGTSDEKVRSAVVRADSGYGVIVLADLGSAVLTVLDVLTESPRTDVVLADAPLVEGAVGAAVLAGAGADLAEVVAAAREAREVPKLP